jgi:DCN1-like protein 1/2
VFSFQEIYIFAWGFSLEKGVKCMQQDTAIAMWRLLFGARPWPLLDAW